MAADPDHPLFRARLEGTALVEASAGTGKTWTITGLYARLILERGLEPRDILAVTYTNAATAELRGRVRATLEALAAHLAGGGQSTDPLVQALASTVPDRETASRRVAAAVASFDEAMICTIHSFCQRALAESAFESALPFETELVPDDRALVREIAEDYWRAVAPGFTRPFAHYLARGDWSPELLAARARPLLAAGDAEVIPPAVPSFDDAAFTSAYDRCSQRWIDSREAIVAELKAARVWQASWVDTAAGHLDIYFARRWPNFDLPNVKIDGEDRPALARFAAGPIGGAMRRTSSRPGHPFFSEVDDLLGFVDAAGTAYARRAQRLVLDFATEARARLAARKRETGQQAYDDLLERLSAALAGPGGAGLAAMLRGRYRAALVDEFQDTDSVQYGIFRRIFVAGGTPLVLVGDPKQAIYGFRGADVFAYLGAAGAAERLPLDTNRRSTPSLVQAINAVFGRAGAFAIDAIEFHPVRPLESHRDHLDIPGLPGPPLTFWWASPDAESKGTLLAKGELSSRVEKATADEIVRLLSAGATLTSNAERRALRGSDIAVLVSTHREADRMRRALTAVGVASVTYGQSSVFESPEAETFARLLAAVSDPLHDGHLRAALATPLVGLCGTRIVALHSDGPAWEGWVEQFQHYREVLVRSGPMRLWREVVRNHDVVARIGASEDGARALTNYRHIAELLHRESSGERLDPAVLARVLARRRMAESIEPDAELLRLETEASLVRVLTVHTSKGLEFPIVFCPFLWNSRLDTSPPVVVRFHDPASGNRLCLDLGSAALESHWAQARLEQLGESLRLAYVAMTRAAHRLYVVHSQVNGGRDSALAWLLNREGSGHAPQEAIAALQKRYAGPASALREDLLKLASANPDAIAVVDLPVPADGRLAPTGTDSAAPAGARTLSDRRIEAARVFSFSGLVTAVAHEAPDHDATARRPDAVPAGDPIEPIDPVFRFPAGASAGSALHAVFERLDFPAASPESIGREAALVLPRFGIAATWADTAAAMVGNALAAPLDGSALRLADVRDDRKRVELQFTFPVVPSRQGELAAVVRSHREEAGLPVDSLVGLDLAVTRGFMKGFIDLVFEAGGRFHIVDYKSNLLGRSLAAYDRPAVDQAIADEYYDLQYLIYSVALDRYLRWRLPGADADQLRGDVFYLFVRGMRPGLGAHGVHRVRPSAALVARLSDLLGAGSGR